MNIHLAPNNAPQPSSSSIENVDMMQTIEKTIHSDATQTQTFIDCIFQHLKDRHFSTVLLDNLRAYLLNEEFDTDSLTQDIMDRQNGSNIHDAIDDEKVIESIVDKIVLSKGQLIKCYP